jgi:hypothetical protein
MLIPASQRERPRPLVFGERCKIHKATPYRESSVPSTIKSQLRSNAIAIISLIVALSSFSYTAWRTERSEHNRTTRQAAFQMLVALGEMKQIVYHGHYDHDAVRGNPRTGWVYVETIRDFSSAMPEPVPTKANALMQSWQTHWEGIGKQDADADAVTDAVDDCRAAVVDIIRMLR